MQIEECVTLMDEKTLQISHQEIIVAIYLRKLYQNIGFRLNVLINLLLNHFIKSLRVLGPYPSYYKLYLARLVTH